MLTKLQRTLILCTMMMGTFITAMSVTVTATMLPAIIADYHIPAQTAQWLTSGATLVSGIMIPVAAYLMKRFPSKVYFLMAMAVFCAGALLGSLAGNFPILLTGRFIQAAGCGMLMPFSQIVLMAVYPKSRHGAVMGIYALGSTVASVISPTLAGFVIDQLGWQAVFWIFTIVGIAVFMLGCFFMKNVMETYRETFPLLPVILSSIGFCGLLVGFGNLNQSFFRLESGGALGIGLVSLALFVYMQLKAEVPFLNLRVFKQRNFRTAVLMSMAMYLVTMGSGSILPIYVQSVLGNSATVFAFITLPGSVVMACTAVCTGRLYDKFGARPLLVCGCALMLIGSAAGLAFHANTGVLQIGITSCLLSAGAGCLNTPTTTMALSGMAGKERVDASSILNTLRQISSAMATTLAVLVYSVMSGGFGDIGGVKAVYMMFAGISIAVIVIMIYFNRAVRREYLGRV